MLQKTPERVKAIVKQMVKDMGSVNKVVKKTGITHNTIGSWLEGRSEPETESLEKLAAATGKSVAWLRGDTENPIPAVGSSSLVDISTLSADSRALWELLQKAPPQKVSKWLALVNMLEKDD